MSFNICHSRPEKESTKVEEEAAEMEDKVSDAEEESSEQRAKSNLKEVNNLSDLWDIHITCIHFDIVSYLLESM